MRITLDAAPNHKGVSSEEAFIEFASDENSKLFFKPPYVGRQTEQELSIVIKVKDILQSSIQFHFENNFVTLQLFQTNQRVNWLFFFFLPKDFREFSGKWEKLSIVDPKLVNNGSQQSSDELVTWEFVNSCCQNARWIVASVAEQWIWLWKICEKKFLIKSKICYKKKGRNLVGDYSCGIIIKYYF